MKVLSFDLSTKCIGVTEATIVANQLNPKEHTLALGVLVSLVTSAIIPVPLKPKDLGYISNRREPVKNKKFKAFLKHKDEVITLKEKRSRDVNLKRESEQLITETLSRDLNSLLERFKPDLVLMEENMAFRSMDVTRRLGEISGSLQALCSRLGIKLIKINVHKARNSWNLSKACIEYAKTLDEKTLKKIDLTKETLKSLILNEYKQYNLNKNMTTDESDSMVIFHYWYELYKASLPKVEIVEEEE